MKTLYFECFSGISGDMTVAALLDLGADKDVLLKGLESLNVGGYHIEISKVKKCGISATDFHVELEDEHTHSHDHHHEDHKHSDDHHGHTHKFMEEGHHHHEAEHGHEHPHPHIHRGIGDILPIIQAGNITDRAKEIAKRIFETVARAEATVHGVPVEEVHFHEVGAVDSIVDIVGVAICLDSLGVERIVSSPVYEGRGYVKCQHGLMPVPAPATAEIARDCGIPLVLTKQQGEMVTPTGAAIIGSICDEFSDMLPITIEKIGVGAGKKEMEHANILRVYELADSKKKRVKPTLF